MPHVRRLVLVLAHRWRFPIRQARHALPAFALLLSGCGHDADETARDAHPALLPGMMTPTTTNAGATPPAVPFLAATPRVLARARASWPHDTAAFTQGLLIDHGRLLEGTGLEGHSELREVDQATGRAARRIPLPDREFGEGIAVAGDRLLQLTWRSHHAYVYDVRTLRLVDSVPYTGEGWGLVSDGTRLYMSDGSSWIRRVDPHGFKEVSRMQITEGGQPVWMLNELEIVHGELWASIYRTDFIARIDTASGHVLGWIDLGGLLTPAERASVESRGGVANGIAYDSLRRRVLVTGKLWPRLFEIERVP